MDPWPATEGLGLFWRASPLSQRGPEHLAAYTHVGCVAAFRRSRPLDHIAPAPLNIATALHAEATGGLSHEVDGVGMDGCVSTIRFDACALRLWGKKG